MHGGELTLSVCLATIIGNNKCVEKTRTSENIKFVEYLYTRVKHVRGAANFLLL